MKNPVTRPDARQVKVRRATVCLPEAMPEEQLREAVLERFGAGPVCVVTASKQLYRIFGEANHGDPMHLAAYGCSSPRVLVLLLQFDDHQLRVVMSLQRPLSQALLRNAQQLGTMPLVLFDEDGCRYAVLECEVGSEDLAAMSELGMPPMAKTTEFRDDVNYIALRCLLHNEQPSLIEGKTLLEVDVALVDA